MPISTINRELLERKLAKQVTQGEDAVLRLTLGNLCKLLDAARDEGIQIARDSSQNSDTSAASKKSASAGLYEDLRGGGSILDRAFGGRGNPFGKGKFGL